MIKIIEILGEPILRGGQESYVMSTIQNMDRSGLYIDLFTPYYCDNQQYQSYMKDIGGEIYCAGLPFAPGHSRRNIVSVLGKMLKKKHYEVAHIHSGSISVLMYAAKICKRMGIETIIVHSHSSGVKENLKHLLIKTFYSGSFRHYATKLCACSLEAAKWKFPKSLLKDTKILNNGIDLDKFKWNPLVRKKIRNELHIDESTFVIGHVGRFTHEKNQIFLIYILHQMIKSNPQIKLVLVGDGEEKSAVEGKAKQLGVYDKVFFIGSVDNPQDYLQSFDVFIFPSLYEGFGLAGIEAQATGMPLVASTGIPRDIQVTENVSFLSLEDDIVTWEQEILKYREINRVDVSEYIRQRGFDIKKTSQDVRALYLMN